MTLHHRAYAWGVKAAQGGLGPSDNPYLNASARAAWSSGYESVFVLERTSHAAASKCRC
ncbi:hypothetical protein [Novosphingobium soli]|uniref:hypothetical protein n=1 Tax=Novosphingobium soli TaxID=574956 RepID=UPI0036D23959